jgi:hypothetical protein
VIYFIVSVFVGLSEILFACPLCRRTRPRYPDTGPLMHAKVIGKVRGLQFAVTVKGPGRPF